MSDTKIDHQLRLENRELTQQIALQEVKLLEKEKAGEALQNSEKRYRRLFESAKDGILILDADTGKVVDVNPFLTRLLGYPYDTFCGKHIWEIGAFKDIAASKEAFQTLQDHEYIRYEDLPLETHYGHPVDVEFVSNVYQVDNNRVIQCNIRDITERKRAEVSMKKGTQLETAMHRIDTQILEGADTREALETACEAIVEMGYRMCWIGRPDPDHIVRPLAYKGFTAGYPENIDVRWDESPEGKGPTGIAIKTGRSYVIQSLHESPLFGPWRKSAIGHGYRSMGAFPLKSGEGEVIGVLDVYSDREGAFGDEEVGRLEMFAQQCSIAVMSARRLETLRDANQRLTFHVSRMPLAYIVWDLECGALEWNPAAERIFGWKANEAIGKNVYELIISEEARPQFKNGWSKLLEGEESSYSLNANVRKNGKIITCEWFNALLRDASGNVSGVLSMVHDVTERAEMERQLQTAQRMEAVGRLAGGVAHDFNNLLTVITGYSELLLQKIGKESPMHGEVEEIKRAGERAASLTQQLLAFSRKQIIEPKVLDLNFLTSDLGKMLIRLIGENIDLKIVHGKNLGLVKVDPGQFDQVLINLAVNSRDAMPDGGTLLIETANVELDEEYCAQRLYEIHPGRYVRLAVSDTGRGMTEETSKQIFEPFFTTKEKGKGTGLGLSMVYGAVKQAGGSIEAHSEVGVGTTFKIYLPCVEEEAVKPVKDGRSTDLPGGTETVLVVEDEGILRKLCVEILERLGYKVLQARKGSEAIAVAQKYGDRIELLLTDVVMPGMNGSELATHLVLHHPEMKVLFTSGYTDDTITRHGVLDEGVSFIGKPYTPLALARKVREVLDRA